MAVQLTPWPPTLFRLNGRRNFGHRQKVPFSLMAGPLTPPPLLNGTAIKKELFRQIFQISPNAVWSIICPLSCQRQTDDVSGHEKKTYFST